MPRKLAVRWLRAGPAAERETFLAMGRAEGLDVEQCRWAEELVELGWRRLATLRALVRVFVPRKPRPDVAASLHLALAELFFAGQSATEVEHVLSSAVEAARDLWGEPQSRFVASALGRVLEARRDGPSDDPRRDLILVSAHMVSPFACDPEENPALWCEDALSLPASAAARWIERVGLRETIERGTAHLCPGDGARALHDAARGLVREHTGLELQGFGTADSEPKAPASLAWLDLPSCESGRWGEQPAARWREPKWVLERRQLARDQLRELLAAEGAWALVTTGSLEPGDNRAALVSAVRDGSPWELVAERTLEPRRDAEHPARARSGGYAALLARPS